MSRQRAITWFKRIQRGGGTYSERMKFLKQFGAGEVARALWHSSEFTLGMEYGILLALAVVFDLQKADLSVDGKGEPA